MFGIFYFLLVNMPSVGKLLLVLWLAAMLLTVVALIRPLRRARWLSTRWRALTALIACGIGFPLLAIGALKVISLTHRGIPIDGGALAAAAGPDGKRPLIVASIWSGNHLLVIDGNTLKTTAIAAQASGPTQGYGLPDGSGFYILNGGIGNATVSAFDARTFRRVKEIQLPTTLTDGGSAIQTDGRYLYVSSISDREFYKIDTHTNAVVQTFRHGLDFAVRPDGKVVFTAERDAKGGLTVASYSTETDQTLGSTVIATEPFSLSHTGIPLSFMSPDGTHLYLTGNPTRILDVTDPATPKLLSEIDLGAPPLMARVTPNGRELWLAISDGTIAIIDTQTSRLLERIKTGRYMSDICFSSDGRHAYVGQTRSDGPLPRPGLMVRIAFLEAALGAGLGGRSAVYESRPFIDTPGEVGVYDAITHRPTGEAIPSMAVPMAMLCMDADGDASGSR